ncbi:C40 family peptidase [Sphingobacterium corticibacter]|uniref:NlpC/P60 family protein n=1 Tax=Sphingobacterium corticibacter TaxID=2171749 RepID=A0A2T8HMG1_9SPHI|nr:C40 family peptidase [Sphingobacterium corticibacter]PVH26590.1 NlpC/P60 family protein [Sphingobacterium corticibacter]
MKAAHLIKIFCLTGLCFLNNHSLNAKFPDKSYLNIGANTHDIVAVTSEVDAEKEIIAFAKKLLGVPYRYGQTSPNTGFDCSGFVYYVFKEFGISLPRSSAGMGQAGADVALEEAKAGDIILFTGTNPAKRSIGHVGIVLSNEDKEGLRFIHASSGKAQAVTETNLEGSYQRRFMKVVRVL